MHRSTPVCQPLLRQLVQSERAGWYFLLLALLFGFALPEAASLVAL